MVAAAAISVPTSIVPVVSIVTWTMSGRSRPASTHGEPRAVDRRLDLQRILAGLAQDHLGATRDQAGGLDRKGLLERAVGDVAERGQAGTGADRADYEAPAAIARELGDRLARELGRAPVDLERALAEVELAERHRRAAEAVGLERVRAGLQVAVVDFPDQIGAAQVEHLGAVLLAPEVAVDRQFAPLDLRPHGAVEEEHPALELGEEIRHGGRSQAACARLGWRPSSRPAASVGSARLSV